MVKYVFSYEVARTYFDQVPDIMEFIDSIPEAERDGIQLEFEILDDERPVVWSVGYWTKEGKRLFPEV